MEDAYLLHLERFSLEKNVSIHPVCYINLDSESIMIGDDALIAHRTTIIAEPRKY